MKPWHFFAASGVVLVFLLWALEAEKGKETPPPFVPYALVALPILLGAGIALAIKRNVGGRVACRCVQHDDPPVQLR